MRNIVYLGVATAVACLWGSGASAQSGAINKAVGGYSFEEAAKEAPATKKDGKPLTFAIITHTAGNGFFDPVYVGAQVAANAFGINLIRLGSEAPIDDIPREIQILNQIVNDPTINGVIMTTPQVGAYNDIVKKLEERGVVVATTNSYDGTLLDRSNISHTGQDASAAAIGGEAIVKCLLKNGVKSGSILFPNTVPVGNIEVNNRVTAAFQATLKALKAAGRLQDFKVDAGPNNIGVDVGTDITAGPIVQLIESRKDVVGAVRAQWRRHAGDRRRDLPAQTEQQDLLLRLRPRTQAARGDQDGSLAGLARPAALPAGLLSRGAALPAARSQHRGGEPGYARAARDQGQRREGRQALRKLSAGEGPSPALCGRGVGVRGVELRRPSWRVIASDSEAAQTKGRGAA